MDKKQVWHYGEFPEDPEASALMPGFEIQYMITKDHVENDTGAVFGHCMFPPRSSHYAHKHTATEEVVYVIKGKVVNGCVDEKGNRVETECGPGMATFVKKSQVHWTRNPYDEPCEFVFAYYGAPSLNDSGYVDLQKGIPIQNNVPKQKVTVFKG
jgi:oxalate decarboxylase/phosphoglucose isomerase-like protein (cupin superfamily)